MNGQIETKLLGLKVTVMGGPYREKPEGIRGVKLAPEINAACDVRLDIPDFGIPAVHAVDDALFQTLKILCEDGVIYLGCMGGIGRTGMFMALLMKTIATLNIQVEEKTLWYKIKNFLGYASSPYLGMRNFSVYYVRDEYLSTAVETDEQYSFVSHYDPTEMLAIRDRIDNCMDIVR
jgi:hypothetical protein